MPANMAVDAELFHTPNGTAFGSNHRNLHKRFQWLIQQMTTHER
jgi:hypothetical protein